MQIITLITFMLLLYCQTSYASSGYTCSLSVPSINCGTIVPYSYDTTVTSSSLSVTCSVTNGGSNVNVSYTLSFSVGNSGNMLSRTILSNANPLNYNIYQDQTLTQILGDGTNGTAVLTANYVLDQNTNPSQTDVFTIYAAIPYQQLAVQGTYNDNIIVTLTY